LADRTLVIFTSDNGGYTREHRGQQVTVNTPLRSGKGSLYEGGIRVPLIVRWPGVAPAGRTCDEPVVTTDFYPTLLEAVGQTGDAIHNDALESKSIVPVLKDPTATLGRDALYFHYPHYYPTTTPVSAVRAGDWKLLEYLEDDRIELYNLKDDLSESKNLAAARPDKARQLRRQLHAWRERVGARMPTPNPDYK
jgi:arylsulfatase A-like enzyme